MTLNWIVDFCDLLFIGATTLIIMAHIIITLGVTTLGITTKNSKNSLLYFTGFG
jgi:hypothetical protein